VRAHVIDGEIFAPGELRSLLAAAVVTGATWVRAVHAPSCMSPRTSTEYGGIGQSGYTAGRHEHDPALDRELQTQNLEYPRGTEEEPLRDELETDERFIGRGGPLPDEEELGRAKS
jgi:hypothetical protein